jgi:hypothetical protein
MVGGAGQVSLLPYLWVFFASRARLARHLRAVRHRQKLAAEELAHLRRLFACSVDSIDALTWQRRQTGAESKFLIENLRERGQ